MSSDRSRRLQRPYQQVVKVVCNVAMGNHKNHEPEEGSGQAHNIITPRGKANSSERDYRRQHAANAHCYRKLKPWFESKR